MPTDPINDIVVRELSPEVEKLFLDWSDKLDEVVNFGSIILDWISNKDGLKGDEEIPLILTLRNSLELIDSISILLTKSSIDPCKNLLRTLLESLFVVSYITEEESETRAINYMVCHFHNKIDLYNRLDPDTPQGKQFQRDNKQDKYGGGMIFADPLTYRNAKERLLRLLQKDLYKNSEEEYQNLHSKRPRRKPVWYQFSNGPNNIHDLAKHLNLSAHYNILYRQFSRSIHGLDIIDGKLGSATEYGSTIYQIRYPKDVQFICQMTIVLSLEFYQSLLKHYIPVRLEDYSKWYISEIQQFLIQLSTKQLFEID